MKEFCLFLVILSIVGVGVFGFLGMSHNDRGAQEHGSGCLAAQARGIDCIPVQDTVELAIFHSKTFLSFSLGIFSKADAWIIFILSVIAAAWFLGLAFLGRTRCHSVQTTFRIHNFWRTKVFKSRHQIQRWFALLEKTQPAFGINALA